MTDKENTTEPLLSSPTSIWTNRFLQRQDMPQESPSLIPHDNDDESDALMNESAPGSLFGSSVLSVLHVKPLDSAHTHASLKKGIRPSTLRRTPAPVPSTLRKEWTQSPSIANSPSRFQSTLAYFGLSPRMGTNPSSPGLNSPRVRRSARLRYKTPLRMREEVGEETEVVYDYRGDTLSGGRSLMPEFFGEHEIIQGESPLF